MGNITAESTHHFPIPVNACTASNRTERSTAKAMQRTKTAIGSRHRIGGNSTLLCDKISTSAVSCVSKSDTRRKEAASAFVRTPTRTNTQEQSAVTVEQIRIGIQKAFAVKWSLKKCASADKAAERCFGGIGRHASIARADSSIKKLLTVIPTPLKIPIPVKTESKVKSNRRLCDVARKEKKILRRKPTERQCKSACQNAVTPPPKGVARGTTTSAWRRKV